MNTSRPLSRVYPIGSNAASTGFTAKTAAILRGTADGGANALPNANCIKVNSAEGAGGFSPASMLIWPFAIGANNDTFSMMMWGWRRCMLGGVPTWFPTWATQFDCTVGSFTGVANGAVLNTELFVDTIALTALVAEATITAATTRFGTVELYSPANNTPAFAKVPLYGAEAVEFDWDQTGGFTPTMNALYEFLDEVSNRA